MTTRQWLNEYLRGSSEVPPESLTEQDSIKLPIWKLLEMLDAFRAESPLSSCHVCGGTREHEGLCLDCPPVSSESPAPQLVGIGQCLKCFHTHHIGTCQHPAANTTCDCLVAAQPSGDSTQPAKQMKSAENAARGRTDGR